MRISDGSSDVCSSDLAMRAGPLWRRRKCLPPRNVGPHRVTPMPLAAHLPPTKGDRKSVVKGKSVSVRVALGGRRIVKKKTRGCKIMRQLDLTMYDSVENKTQSKQPQF